MFDITRVTRQGSKLSPYLLNILGGCPFNGPLSGTKYPTRAASPYPKRFYAEVIVTVFKTRKKNKGQWNAKSGPKAAYGNVAMRTQFSERLDLK